MTRLIIVLATLLIMTGTASAEVKPVRTTVVLHHAFEKGLMPVDMVLDRSGSHAVLEAVQGRVHRFAGERHVGSAPLPEARGAMCFVRFGGRYFVCNPHAESVLVYDRFLRRKSAIVRPETLSGKPFDPTDIVFAGADEAVIADNDNHRLIRLNPDTGEYIAAVGRFGFDNREFRFPYALARAANGDIYASDVLNTRIQKFTPRLKFVNVIGGWGIEAGQFFRPKGIALWSDRYLFVADGTMGLIEIFAANGAFIGVVSDPDGNFRRWRNPVRLRIEGDLLAVIDFLDATVDVLKVEEVLP